MPDTKVKLPNSVISGEKARLIPVVSDTSREVRATSILLSILASVNEFAQSLFGAIGIRIGARTEIEVYTEVVFADKGKKEALRPDGLIVVNTGRSKWKALVEAKIGNAELKEEQIKDYLALAKKYNIDAVITLSNQYAAIPTHHPIKLKKNELKGVEIYHWSWMFVLTEAILLLKSMGVEDVDQQFLLQEMVRYYNHDSVGVSSFSQMNKEWKDVVMKVSSGSNLAKTSEEVENTVSSWHQEVRDLCLIMTQSLAVPVVEKIGRKHKSNPKERLKDDCDVLANEHILKCQLDVPNAASALEVVADFKRRTVDCFMRVQAPKDKKRGSARLNWLLRQLKGVEPEGVFIRAITQGRGTNLQAPLTQILEDPESLLNHEGTQIQPTAFEVIYIRDLAGRFSGRNTFVQEIDEAVPYFYEIIGQNLSSWTPPAPKVKKASNDDNVIQEIEEAIDVVE